LTLAEQKAILVHCLEDDALEPYNTLPLTNTSTLADVLAAFETFVIGESNETYERFLFNRRVQEAGERFEYFYADLQRLMTTCNYCPQCKDSSLW